MCAGHEQALLRRVRQVALVPDGAAKLVAGQAELVQPGLQLMGLRARQWQVVGAERAGDAADRVAARIAAKLIFQLEQRKVVDAGLPQRAGGRETGNAAAGDQHRDATRRGRRA